MKLDRNFYNKPALEIVKDFLGKYLVYNSPKGVISGKIIDVEAYPAFVDNVSHANKRTPRTEVLYGPAGHVYIYLIYGKHYQFSIVVNKKNVPDVIFIRAVVPQHGTHIMLENFGRKIKNIKELTKSPGSLCKSFGITKELYGADITGNLIYIEDRGEYIDPENIKSSTRIGINKKLSGSSHNFRYYI